MRRRYESCSCCLSDAYPEVKATLDAERAAKAEPEVAARICEIAKAAGPATTQRRSRGTARARKVPFGP